MNRQQRIGSIAKVLGSRKIIWFGGRGYDAQPLLALPLPVEVFSFIAPLNAATILQETSLEILKGRRVDLDRYDIDVDGSRECEEFWSRLVVSLSSGPAIVAYRGSEVLDSLRLIESGTVRYLGIDRCHQAIFENKLWMETILRRAGISVIPSRYFGKEDCKRLLKPGTNNLLVVRGERSAGGESVHLVHDQQGLIAASQKIDGRVIAVSPYLSDSIPLNVNACVFPGGNVSCHAPSLQLIGLEGCTTRRFGYCGNDFCKCFELDLGCLDQLEEVTMVIGKVLNNLGYLGAFGVDALWHNGRLYVSEVNPRFQGSSSLAARIAKDLDISDLFLDHMAAFLGLPPSPRLPLRALVREHGGYAHVVCHNLHPFPVKRSWNDLPLLRSRTGMDLELMPANDVEVGPHGISFRVVVREKVTEQGYTLLDPVRSVIAELARECGPPARDES